jgi:hypothetical protein
MKILFLLVISSFIAISAMAQSAYHGSEGDGYSSFTSKIKVNSDGVISIINNSIPKAISLNKGDELPSDINRILSVISMQGQNITDYNSKNLSLNLASGIYQVQFLDAEGNKRKVIIRLL